jgi:FKBP-type peptidyl-prolyl cis-trans isomerase
MHTCSRLDAQSGAGEGAQVAPETEEEKTLYALGAMVSRNLQGFELSPEEVPLVLEGLRDALEQRESAVPLDEYSPKVQALAAERRAGRVAIEKEAGAAFLAQEAEAEGAETFESGLVMRVLVPGSGASPAATDTVKVHYHGTLRDGSVFDSSVERDQPASIPLNRVVPCWTEALQKMSVGEKTRIACPSDIAYGDRGSPPAIPPGAVLIFEVELLEIVAAS